MTQPLNLALTLSLNDRLVAPLQRALGDAQRTLRDVSRELDGVGRTGAQAAQGLQQIGRQADGVRTATREVRALGQAADDAERRVSRLGSVFGTLRNVTRGVAGIAAGGAAAGAALAGPVQRAADYDTQLRHLSNTAFAGQPLASRRAGLATLDSAIMGAVRTGGGTRDDAMKALEELTASGAFGNAADAVKVLPLLMRGATGSGASAEDLAKIAIAGQKTFRISGPQMSTALDMAMAAGQAGGFELRDMAKYLPEQMAAASQLGLAGTDGLVQLLAANQASVITAGSKDKAGNNLVNLLAKISAPDTNNDFNKLNIDLAGSLAFNRAKGIDGLTTFLQIADKVVGSDKRFQQARAGAASTDDAVRKESFLAQEKILQGSAVGKFIQDREALLALIPLMNNRDYVADVKGKVRNSSGAIGSAFDLISEGPGFKFQQREAEVQRAQIAAMSSANSVIVKLAEAQTDLYSKYPDFGKAVEGAGVALWGLTAAAAAAGAAKFLLGGGAGVVGSATTGAAGAAVATSGKAIAAGGARGFLGKLLAPLALMSELFYTSDADKRVLIDAEMTRNHRGKGFDDPRVIGYRDTSAQDLATIQLAAAAKLLGDKLENLNIHVTTDTSAMTAEIMKEAARDARRN